MLDRADARKLVTELLAIPLDVSSSRLRSARESRGLRPRDKVIGEPAIWFATDYACQMLIEWSSN